HSNDHPDSSRDPPIVAKHPNAPEFEFGLDQLLIMARTKAPFSRLLWSYQLESRIAKAWIYSSNPNVLEPLRLFVHDVQAASLADRLHSDQIQLTARANEVSQKKTLSDFIFGPKIRLPKHSSRDPECPSRDRLVYLGQVDRNLYVQLEDNFDLPNPSQITLSRFDRPESSHESTSTSSSSESSRFALVGYYRATYAAHAADEICLQPFVSSSRRLPSRPIGTDQRALVPWRPMSLMDKWANNPDHTPSSSDPNTPKQTEAFSDWVFESTRDLFTLLLQASELSDRSDGRFSRRDSTPIVWWDRFGHTVHLCLLICVLYLADRLFRLFHGNGDLCLATLTDHPKQTNMTEVNLDVSFQRDACFTPNRPDDNANKQSDDNAIDGVSQLGELIDDNLSKSGIQSNAARERRLSVSCGTQAAPVFISVYETEFSFVRCLGRGAFGRVFEVENRFDGCRYAIKRIEVNEVGEDETRFLREVRVLASLDHPGIVRYHRAWSEHPPPGWQIARDMALFGPSDDDTGADTGCSWEDYSIRQTNDCQPGRTGSLCDKVDSSSRLAPFEPDLDGEISGPDVRLSLNRRLDESLIVFQRDTASDSGSCAQSDQSVISGSSANRTNRRSKRNRTTSTSEPTSNTSWYLYIQMQLCSQMSLRDWLSSKNHANSRPERAELYYMFWQIVDAVAYLHAHELMHRDLKPSNILFDSANRLKLADFGLVTSFADEDVNVAADYEACGGTGDVTRVLDYTTSAPGLVSSQKADKHGDSGHADSWSSSGDATDLSSNHVRHKYFGLRAARRQHTNDVGTDLYMSPEQERRERYDRKVDIFSLGLIFLELLLPFETDMERICTLLQAKRQILPEEFTLNHPAESALIRSLLDPNPHRRPSAADLVHDPLLSQAKSDQPHLLSCTTNIALRTVV
ncbi:Eukaryotic translation initiation factor 2-alpha kinase, partial [Fasciolopsis buskii]